MFDISTQLRDYFDAHVERVTPEDVFAGRRTTERIRRSEARWLPSPRLATAIGFGVTVMVIGGSLGLGLLLRQSDNEAGSSGFPIPIDPGTPAAAGWTTFGIAVAMAAIALIFILLALRTQRSDTRKQKENTMATTLETQPTDSRLDGANRANRWLVIAVVLLTLAVAVLGILVVRDLTAADATEGPAELQALLEDYSTAWNTYDGEAFLGLVDSNYVHIGDGINRKDAATTAAMIERSEPAGTQAGFSSDPVIVDADPVYYIIGPVTISTAAVPKGVEGVGLMRVIHFPASGWKVTYHEYVGDLPIP